MASLASWLRRATLVLWLLSMPQAWAETAAIEPKSAPTISLLTFAPGEVYWQRFGHNALLVREPGGRRHVYNYGVFDFQQKNFFLNFARGHMLYQLVEQSLYETLLNYRYEGRWVYEQQLELDEAQRRELAAFLAWNALPQNAEYQYDYFRSNCSTRVRDAIDRVLGGELRRQLQAQPAGVSYRFEATRLIGPVRPLFFGMDAVMGPNGDVGLDRWQQSFVPMVLMEAVRGVRLRDTAGAERPLVHSEGWLVHSEQPREPSRPPAILWPLLGLGLLLATALLLLDQRRGNTAARWGHAALASGFSLICALGGLVLMLVWGLTEHWSMWANRNLLLFSPLCFALLPLWLRSFRRQWRIFPWERGLALLLLAGALLALLLLLLPGAQQNLPWIALLLPPHAALAWVLYRARSA